MTDEIKKFLHENNIAVLSVMLSDGSPHGAAIHFSHTDEPLNFYFQTKIGSRKCEALVDGRAGKASVVVGFDEKEMITIQLDGEVRQLHDEKEIEALCSIHYAKHPYAAKHRHEGAAFLKFTPTWWRYSDYSSRPPRILMSN